MLTTVPDVNLEEIFEKNRNLALRFAGPYLRSFPSLREEIQQAAYFGLWEAILRWDPNKGALSTLASFWVRAQIQEVLKRSLSPLTLGDGDIKDIVSGKTSISVLRLDEEVREGEEGDFHDLIPSPESPPWEEVESKLERELANRLLGELSARERLLLKALHGFYGRRFTEKEMAAFFGVGVKGLRKEVERLLSRLRKKLEGW